MEIKLYSDTLYILDRIISSLCEEIEKTPDTEETAAYLELLEERIYKTMSKKESILKAIESIENKLYKKILTEHYIKGKTLEKTAYVLNYSDSYIYKLQNKALQAFYKRFNNE